MFPRSAPIARRTWPATILVLVALALASSGCASPIALLSGVPVQAAATASAPAYAATWYDLYFTTPELTANLPNPTGGIPDKVAASFDAAQHTIDLAIYQFDLLPIANSLLRAGQRGVQVRVVTDSDSLDMDAIQSLIRAGIPVVPDRRSAIMHDKFAVVDAASVWTGSMNFTYNDAYRNDNNFIQIRSPQLAQNYTHEFEKMFVNKQFGAHTRVDTPNPLITLAGTKIENYFAPKGAVASHIEDVLAAAQHSIYFMAFDFTRRDFGQTLLDQAAAGLDVRGVFESQQLAAGGDAVWQMLANGGLADNERKDGNPKKMHNKVFVVDRAIVETGSYNFSASAENSNDENVIIIHDPAIAAAYYAQWERIWAEGKK